MVLRLLTIGLCILLSSLPATRASDDDDGDAVMVDSATADFRGYDRDYMADWRSDWAGLTGRMNNPKCIDIPANLTLCRDIGYSQMRLPNLLDHDTIREVGRPQRGHDYTTLIYFLWSTASLINSSLWIFSASFSLKLVRPRILSGKCLV